MIYPTSMKTLAKLKYIKKIELKVTEGKLVSGYQALKKLSLRPGEVTQTGFQLPSHENLSQGQSAEVLAEHFSQISQ